MVGWERVEYAADTVVTIVAIVGTVAKGVTVQIERGGLLIVVFVVGGQDGRGNAGRVVLVTALFFEPVLLVATATAGSTATTAPEIFYTGASIVVAGVVTVVIIVGSGDSP